MDLRGMFSVLVTPFDENLNFDEYGFRANLKFQLDSNVDGIVVLGTTGESPTLVAEEQEKIIKIALEKTAGKVPLVVGTGSYSTAQTIEKTKKAQQLGADAALIITPYYNKPTQEGLYQHFRAIAQAVNLPIIVYNCAGRTGQNLSTATLQRIAEFSNIVGVKEASGNMTQIMEVISAMKIQRPDFKIFSGDDVLTFPLMAMGGHGVLSVASNLVPGVLADFVKLLQNGRYSEALEMHYRLMPLFQACFIETNPIPVKTAMELWDMPAGKCRLPLCDITSANQQFLKNLLEQYEWARSESRF